MDRSRIERLAEVARIAARLETATGCPAKLLIAQWAVESQWGTKPGGQANYFGIKRAARHQKCCTVVTHEVNGGRRSERRLEFADYGSLEESCRDYAWLITHGAPYRKAWTRYQVDHDLNALITGVARTYATDPAYARMLKEISEQSNVAWALQAATQEQINA